MAGLSEKWTILSMKAENYERQITEKYRKRANLY